jgi:hypothetical protein
VSGQAVDLRGVKPILLTGIPRSGTTWVGRILAASGKVGYVNEPFNLAVSPGSFRVPAEHWYTYVTAENEGDVLPALTPALTLQYPLARELGRCRNRTDLLHTLRSWRAWARRRGQRPLIKEPHAVFSAEWFARRLDSQIVVMIRDPLAVVSSWKRLGWTVDFGDLLDQPLLMRDWLEPFEREMSLARSASWSLVEQVALLWRLIYSVVADERYPHVYLLRHEDLSRDPVGEYAKLYDALDLTFDDAVLKAVARSSSADNPAETSVEKPHETRLDSKANLENWRHRLSDAEIRQIERLTADVAAHYYPADE